MPLLSLGLVPVPQEPEAFCSFLRDSTPRRMLSLMVAASAGCCAAAGADQKNTSSATAARTAARPSTRRASIGAYLGETPRPHRARGELRDDESRARTGRLQG